MRRTITCIALLTALSACNFEFESPLFAPEDGVRVFDDGVRVQLRDHAPGEGEWHEYPEIELIWDGAEYQGTSDREGGGLETTFIPVTDTIEDDYIVQMVFHGIDAPPTYAFIWRSASVFKVVGAPGFLDDLPAAADVMHRRCTRGLAEACIFSNREGVVEFYREAIYPTFVQPDSSLHGVGYLVPIRGGER